MILRGLYNTKIDRMRTEKYLSYMFNHFGIMVNNDLSSYKSKGFIMKDVYYKLWIPKIDDDGNIISFKHEYMEYIGNYKGIVELKRKIKELIYEQPEKFKSLSEALKR